MIEIKIEKSTCDHGATIYTATPAEICLGGLDASQVDEIHVTPPEDWSGCTIRLTIVPHFAPRIARILDDTGVVTVTSDMTLKKSGVIVIDAQNADGYAAYSTDIRYTAYDHQRAGTASGQPSPSEYQQMIAMAAEGVKSVNGVKPDENGDVQVQGGGVSDDQISQAVSDYMTANPVDIPEVLPNPSALTFTGVVTGSYDGSEPLEVEIPSGGGIDIASAEVGQIIKVAAVDDNGKPTEWEAAFLPDWDCVVDITVDETNLASYYEYDIEPTRMLAIFVYVATGGTVNSYYIVRLNNCDGVSGKYQNNGSAPYESIIIVYPAGDYYIGTGDGRHVNYPTVSKLSASEMIQKVYLYANTQGWHEGDRIRIYRGK